jgi:hypothetical protein
MSPERTSKCLAGIRQLSGLLREIDSVKHTLSGLVELKNLQRKTVVRMIRDITTAAKRSKTSAPEIIAGMQLVYKPVEVDKTVVAPKVKVTSYPGFVEVAFDKKILECVDIYCRRAGSEGWEYLNKCGLSPYIDKRPLKVPGQPERREYKAVYVNDKGAIGQFSSIVKVMVDE